MNKIIDRKKFYDGVRGEPFHSRLKAVTVKNCNEILDEFERRDWDDLGTAFKYLAYIFATRLAECGQDMAPVREGFKKTDAEARAFVKRRGYKYAKEISGQVYYGRGGVQLTWLDNYIAMEKLLKVPLVNNPDLALDPAISTQIQFEGMLRGTFTGKKLSHFFAPGKADWKNARTIINRLDRADEIANYGKQFYADILNAAT